MFDEIKKKAKARVSENYVNQLVVFILYTLLISALSATGIGLLLLGGPLTLGVIIFFVKDSIGQKGEIMDLFSGFNNFSNSLVLYLLETIYVFLWSLLLVIPGIIKTIAYSQAYYILNDEPTLSGSEALKKSEQMMKGHKWEYFVLELSFIGWWILSAITCGLVYVLYFAEYHQAALAEYYLELKSQSSVVVE